VPPDAKDDKALKMADDLLHGVKVNASAPATATDTGDKAAMDKPAVESSRDKPAAKEAN
jgi:carboxyl-terminal processing protease